MTIDDTLVALAKLRLARSTSYSALLFIIWNSSLTAHSIMSPFGDFSITPTSPACLLDKLSVLTTHGVAPHSMPSPSSIGVNSTMKSTKAYALMAVLSRYWTSNLLSLVAQTTILPSASVLFIAFLNGLFVKTIMVWAWKYCLSLRAAITKASAIFSIGGIPPQLPSRLY